MSASFALDDDSFTVVIGAGAGGGTLAHRLTEAGRKVVVLEAGPSREPAHFIDDEIAGAALLWDEPRTSSGTHPDSVAYPAAPALMAKGVGGSTKMWTGLTPRLKAHEFRGRTTYGQVQGANLADWPIQLEDLVPYYERAEREIGTSHRFGRPPMPANNNYKVLANGAREIGYEHYATGPYATNVDPFDGRPGTVQDGFNMQGDRGGSKWSTRVREIPRAMATGLLDLRTGCHAVEITQSAAGRVDGVVYQDAEGRERRQRAGSVAVAGNAIETPRLLLLSQNRWAPTGLGNAADLVGRFYTRHVTGYVLGHFDQPVNMHRGENMAGLVGDESRHDPARGFVGGYHLELIGLGPVGYASVLEPVHHSGPELTELMEAYSRTAALWICGEDMPMADNRVTLDGAVTDRRGLPVPHVHMDQHCNDVAMREHAWRQGRRMYEAVGAWRTTPAPGLPSGHNHGTTRMGDSPDTSVVDPFGRVHGLDNLFVSDCSMFPSSAAANPPLTLLALVHRQADHMLAGNSL